MSLALPVLSRAKTVRPTSKISFKIVRPIVEGLLRALIRLEIRGKEKLPANGPIIAVCNHLSLLDPVLHIISILPRDSIFMAKEELFRWWPVPLFPVLMRIAEAFPVRRRGTPAEKQEAIRKAEEVLGEGFIFGIYPEGSRSKRCQLKEAYQGVALVALRSGAPLIPAAIWGTEKLSGINWLKRPTVTICFGEPFTVESYGDELTNGDIKAHTDFIMRKLASVLPPEYRGIYGP